MILPDCAAAQFVGSLDTNCTATSCDQLVYVGTHGAGEGVVAARFDPSTGRLVKIGAVGEIFDPAWLVASPHRAILYAASEVRDHGQALSTIQSFAVNKSTGALTAISRVSSGGVGVTQFEIVSESPPPAIIVANGRSGQISVVPLGPVGVLRAPTSVLSGNDLASNQRRGRAHPSGVAADASGSFIFVADCGGDQVLVDRFDAASGRLTAYDAVKLPRGSQPRHLAVTPGGRSVYANAKASGGILILQWNADTHRLSLTKQVPTRTQTALRKTKATDLKLSADSRFLYASLTGENAIVVYAVDIISGGLREIQRLPSGGTRPSTLAIDPSGRWLAVSNAGSGRVAIFSCNPATGMIVPTVNGLNVTHPTSVAWLLR